MSPSRIWWDHFVPIGDENGIAAACELRQSPGRRLPTQKTYYRQKSPKSRDCEPSGG
jgi:hypothetical protein